MSEWRAQFEQADGVGFAVALRRRLLGFVVVLGGGMFMLLVAALGWFTLDQDKQAAAMSRRIAASAIAARVEFMDKAVTQYAVWDDPIERVLIHPDHQWMDDTIGPYVFDQLHVEQSFVVTRDGNLLYAMRDRRSGRAEQRIDNGLRLLGVKAARQTESVPMGQVALVDGRVAIVGVQKLARSTGRFARYGDTRAAMIFVDFLDDAKVLRDIEATYALDRLGIAARPGSTVTGAIPLYDGIDQSIGWLTWQQNRPGRNTLQWLAPVIAMLALALAFATAAIGKTVQDIVAQMLADRRVADNALVRARVALEAAQAAQGDAARVRQQLREVELAHAELADLRDRSRYAA